VTDTEAALAERARSAAGKLEFQWSIVAVTAAAFMSMSSGEAAELAGRSTRKNRAGEVSISRPFGGSFFISLPYTTKGRLFGTVNEKVPSPRTPFGSPGAEANSVTDVPVSLLLMPVTVP
jgi:hypothetical protein